MLRQRTWWSVTRRQLRHRSRPGGALRRDHDIARVAAVAARGIGERPSRARPPATSRPRAADHVLPVDRLLPSRRSATTPALARATTSVDSRPQPGNADAAKCRAFICSVGAIARDPLTWRSHAPQCMPLGWPPSSTAGRREIVHGCQPGPRASGRRAAERQSSMALATCTGFTGASPESAPNGPGAQPHCCASPQVGGLFRSRLPEPNRGAAHDEYERVGRPNPRAIALTCAAWLTPRRGRGSEPGCRRGSPSPHPG